ncbi:MAG: terminase family protein [Pseudomonadota bacterium]
MSTTKLRTLFLNELDDDEIIRLKFDWPLWARLKQRPPLNEWRTWLLLGGRGSGKTRTGAEWLKGVALADPHYPGSNGGRVALVGTTYDDIRDVMIEGESGLLAISHKSERPQWLVSKRELIWPNGTVGKLFSSADPESLRGSQFGAAWLDDSDSWENAEIPLDAGQERYVVQVLNMDGNTVREAEVQSSEYMYSFASQLADFGHPASHFTFKVVQLSDSGLPGAEAVLEAIIT